MGTLEVQPKEPCHDEFTRMVYQCERFSPSLSAVVGAKAYRRLKQETSMSRTTKCQRDHDDHDLLSSVSVSKLQSLLHGTCLSAPASGISEISKLRAVCDFDVFGAGTVECLFEKLVRTLSWNFLHRLNRFACL